MHKVIDTPWDTTEIAPELKRRGVETVMRYYNQRNSRKLPEKRVEKAEAEALAAAGLSLAVVFQQGGGAEGRISDLSASNGKRDGARALEIARDIGQPKGSAIYFAVDHDYFRSAELTTIRAYFKAVAAKLKGKYRVGVYGSGLVGRTVRDAGYAELIWLAAARGWSGTRDMLETDQWALYQRWPPINDPIPHDGNTISAAWHDYGQFTPGAASAGTAEPGPVTPAPNTVLMEVTARNGLRVRRGPGSEYTIETTLAQGTLVHVIARTGDWVMVDIEGDDNADGFMHGDFLRAVSGGLPEPVAPVAMGGGVASAYAVARAELARDIREVPGGGNNPRIVMYHNTTTATAGTDDSVAWCSSFVNYCVEQAGMDGTNSQWARSWEHWGQDVTGTPEEGDIVVFERVGKGGHVGFFRADLGTHVSVLGGNQSNRVKISSYPKKGKLGSNTYKLLSIRRG